MKNENEKLLNDNKKAKKGSGNEIEELPEENPDNKSKKVGKVLFEKSFSKGNIELLKNGTSGH